MFNNKFPTGEPECIIRFTQDQLETLPFMGLIKCRVVPPERLELPLLPYRVDQRLTFPLCGRCAKENKERTPCSHTDEERALVIFPPPDRCRY